MFRGYLSDYESPSETPIRSWQDWKHVLTQINVEIEDEYGTRYPMTRFIRDVEATPPELRRKQYDQVTEDNRLCGYRRSIGQDWLDADGFSFYSEDFS